LLPTRSLELKYPRLNEVLVRNVRSAPGWARGRNPTRYPASGLMQNTLRFVVAMALVAACNSGREAAVSTEGAEHPFVQHVANHPSFPWRVYTTEHFVVRGIDPSFASDNLSSLADSVERAREFVLRQLGETDIPRGARAHVFLVRGPDDFRELIGQPAGGWTEPEANAVLAAVHDSGPPPLRHELGHLYSHRLWGRPHATWLSEGVAVYAAGHCAGIPLHQWAAAIQRAGDPASLDVLAREFDFARAAPHLLAGSFITFVAEAHGIAAVKTLWRIGLASTEQATGVSAASLQGAWHDQLSRIDVPRDMPDFRGRVRCETGAG
jgi:hypothetical protein